MLSSGKDSLNNAYKEAETIATDIANGAQEFVPSVSNAILRAELRGYKEGIQDADEIVREGGKKGFLALAITGFFLLLLMYGFPILDLIRQHIKC
jgi:hypothetical protein